MFATIPKDSIYNALKNESLGCKLQWVKAEQWNIQGLQFMHADKNFPKAIAAFSRAVFLKPLEPSYYFHRAEAHFQVAEFEPAIVNYRECTKLLQKADQTSPFLHQYRLAPLLFIWSRCLLEQERFQEALNVLGDARAMNFRNDDAIKIQLVLAYVGLDQLTDALEHVLHLIKSAPSQAAHQLLTASVYQLHHDVVSTFHHLTQAIALDPKIAANEEALRLQEYVNETIMTKDVLATKNIRAGLAEEALKCYNRALEVTPKEDVTMLLKRAELYLSMQRLEAAQRDLESIAATVNARPSALNTQQTQHLNILSATCYHQQGVLCHQAKSYDAALQFLSLAVTQNGMQYTHRLARACVMSDLGRFEEALTDLHLAAKYAGEGVGREEVGRKCAQVHGHIGNGLYLEGRHVESVREYATAIEYDPTGASYYYRRGRGYLELAKIDEARIDLRRAISLNPGYPEALSLLSNMTIAPYKDGYKAFSPFKMFKHAKGGDDGIDVLEPEMNMSSLRNALAPTGDFETDTFSVSAPENRITFTSPLSNSETKESRVEKAARQEDLPALPPPFKWNPITTREAILQLDRGTGVHKSGQDKTNPSSLSDEYATRSSHVGRIAKSIKDMDNKYKCRFPPSFTSHSNK